MSGRHHLVHLRESAPVVLPSLLLCDFGNLEREVAALERAGVAALHLDVMDGCFVPNLTYGMPIVAALRRLTSLPLDVHLMIDRPEQFVPQFAEAGADLITIHVESAGDTHGTLKQIRDLGLGAGLALNPGTPLNRIQACLGLCDLVLVMSVAAGFGGQSFQPVALEKLERLRAMVDRDVLLEVDGGINEETIRGCAESGAQMFVVGSAIFGQPDYSPVVAQLTELASTQTL